MPHPPFATTPTSATWLLFFRDARPPHAIQASLERQLMTLFTAERDPAGLSLRAHAKVYGPQYVFVLRFEAALARENSYSLRVEASWADLPATHRDYFRKNAESWFGLWARDFTPAAPPAPGEGSAERYTALVAATLDAESHLVSVEAIQAAIVAGLKRGGLFSTAHKEGGTQLRWLGDRFVRSDYGESEERQEFTVEAEFLKFLRQFYDAETSRSVYPAKPSEFVAWKLILRLLRAD